MTKRFPHWITTAKEGVWPSAIITVDVTATSAPLPDNPKVSREYFQAWSARGLRRDGDRYQCVYMATHSDVDEFWRVLTYWTERLNHVWILSYQCGRVWALLDLWRRLASGEAMCPSHDYRYNVDIRDRLRERRRRQADPLRPVGGGEAAALGRSLAGYMVLEDPPCIAKLRTRGAAHLFQWVDVRNYGVESLGEHRHGADTAAWLAEWVTAACRLLRKYRLGALRATAGSQAMAGWRHSYYGGTAYVHHHRAGLALEGAAYIGGRCEARRLGPIPLALYRLDFRSQYGGMCAEWRVPARISDYREYHGSYAAPNLESVGSCIADVTIETNEPAYPKRRGDDVIYPIGRYRTVLCGPELTDAVEHGRVMAWHAVAVYEMDYLLRDYALATYAMRCEVAGSPVHGIAAWAKRLIVSIVGKLGQRDRRWVDDDGQWTDQQWGEWHGADRHGKVWRFRSLAGRVQRDVPLGFSHDALPAVAAWICSAARLALLNAIRCAGWDHIYYYDTDSLFVDERGSARLLHGQHIRPGQLGGLEVREGPIHCDIRGVKYYVTPSGVTCSGQPKGRTIDLGDGQHYYRLLSVKEAIRSGEMPSADTAVCNYQRAGEYTHGNVQADGSVTPLELWED